MATKKKQTKQRKKTRKFPLTAPCKMGREVTKYLGTGTRNEIADRRRILAEKLEVSAGYLRFLEVGEVDDRGKAMRPSQALLERWKKLQKRAKAGPAKGVVHGKAA